MRIWFVWLTAVCLPLAGCGATRGPAGPPEVLQQSWYAYVKRFVQKDGRVIDHSAGDISTSEGQAYAMLRAVWIGDRATFDKTFTWAVNNLNSGVREDHLWAWKWGRAADGKWRVLDAAFATDADQDAAYALLVAYRQWDEPKYLHAALDTLSDLWRKAVVEINGRRFLLAGDSLCERIRCKVNPSYYAPYAYRVFARYDQKHNWLSLVDASYGFLEHVSGLTATRLPPDWVYVNTETGLLTLGDGKDSSFSYDAFRVFWRIALDVKLFREQRAENQLRESTAWLTNQWQSNGKLPAVISRTGNSRAEYESLDMLAGVLPAVSLFAPKTAEQIRHRLDASYSGGLWGNPAAYYLQNWAWFGIALQEDYLAPLRDL